VTGQPDESAARVARDAAVQSLASNLVYLALMIGITVGIARRDWLTQQRLRLERWLRRPERHPAAMAEVRRDIDRLEYGYGWRQRQEDR
jgi:hypothetical protein